MTVPAGDFSRLHLMIAGGAAVPMVWGPRPPRRAPAVLCTEIFKPQLIAVHGTGRGSFQLEPDGQDPVLLWIRPPSLVQSPSNARKKIRCSLKQRQGFVWGAFALVLLQAT